MGVQIGRTESTIKVVLMLDFLLQDFFSFVRRKKVQGKNTHSILQGEYLSKQTGLCSLALGTPRGAIWQTELLLLRVVWLAS